MTGIDSSDKLIESFQSEVGESNKDLESLSGVITADATRNKQLILEVLHGIDLTSSRLPIEFLEEKKTPLQSVGDFEKKLDTIISVIEQDRTDYDFDISSLDIYLFYIAKMLDAAVAIGCTESAVAARVGLTQGYRKLRMMLNVPQSIQAKKQYLKKCSKYMHMCYTYITLLNNLDVVKRNVEQAKKSIEIETRRVEENKRSLAANIVSNPSLKRDIAMFYHYNFRETGSQWSAEMVDLYKSVVQTRIAKSNLMYKGMLVDVQLKRMIYLREAADKMKAYLMILPVPDDPDVEGAVRGVIDDTFKDAEKASSEMNRLMDMKDDFDERRKAIAASGSSASFAFDEE